MSAHLFFDSGLSLDSRDASTPITCHQQAEPHYVLSSSCTGYRVFVAHPPFYGVRYGYFRSHSLLVGTSRWLRYGSYVSLS